MIPKFQMANLRNAEHYQFINSASVLFARFKVDSENLAGLYGELDTLLKTAEEALALEKKNEKVREKNDMDRYRDRLHSKLFNHLKSILYDERDDRFDDAQAVMRVVRETGNPTRLAENAESAMLTTLGNRLEPYRNCLEAINAQTIVDALMEANRQFIVLEQECRELLAARKAGATPPSMSAVRKQIDPLYRTIINAINGSYGIPSKKEACSDLVIEMTVLVEKYDALLMARKKVKKETPTANP